MARRMLVGAIVATVVSVGLSTAAHASTTIALLLPQSTAFTVLGHSCGGIQEQSLATGFDAVSGDPTGDVYLQTRCGGSGRGGGYTVTTYAAWVSASWDFTGAVSTEATLASAPGTIDPTFTAFDANGNEVSTVLNAVNVLPPNCTVGDTTYCSYRAYLTVVQAPPGPVPCGAGTFSATGNAPCTAAPPGTFVTGTGATAPTPCPAGSYQPNSSATACLPAPVGTFVPGSGATSPTPCPVGTGQELTGQASCDPLDFYVATVTVPDAAPGVRFSMPLHAVGASTRVRWRLVDGTLPRGLRVRPTGLVAGVPNRRVAAPGDYVFTVQATARAVGAQPARTTTQVLILTLS